MPVFALIKILIIFSKLLPSSIPKVFRKLNTLSPVILLNPDKLILNNKYSI